MPLVVLPLASVTSALCVHLESSYSLKIAPSKVASPRVFPSLESASCLITRTDAFFLVFVTLSFTACEYFHISFNVDSGHTPLIAVQLSLVLSVNVLPFLYVGATRILLLPEDISVIVYLLAIFCHSLSNSVCIKVFAPSLDKSEAYLYPSRFHSFFNAVFCSDVRESAFFA